VQFQGAYAELVQKLQAGLAAGEVPDLVLLDSPFVALFAKDGVLVPLDDFASNPDTALDLETFIPGLLQDGYYQGTLYALPLMRSTPLLYFNRDMFAEVGLPDRVPETWDEFREFAAKLTKEENGEIVRSGVSFTMGQTTAHWYLQGAIYAFGGEVSDADFNIKLTEPEAKAAAQLWQDMVFTDKTAMAGRRGCAERLPEWPRRHGVRLDGQHGEPHGQGDVPARRGLHAGAGAAHGAGWRLGHRHDLHR
jgi:sn-glycerol 3-phosphate transport system substrate-binding protein